MNPRNNLSWICYWKGMCHHNQKEYKEAIECYTKAIENEPHTKNGFVYSGRGDAYLRNGNMDESIEDYSKAI